MAVLATPGYLSYRLTSLLKLEGQQATVRLRYCVPVLRLIPGSVMLTLLGGRGLSMLVMPKIVVLPRPSATREQQHQDNSSHPVAGICVLHENASCHKGGVPAPNMLYEAVRSR